MSEMPFCMLVISLSLECVEIAATKVSPARLVVPSIVRCQPGAIGACAIPIVPTASKTALPKLSGWPVLEVGPVQVLPYNMPCATTRVRISLG